MSTDPSAADLLNEQQRRHLSVSLARVEQALHRVSELSGVLPPPAETLLVGEARDLPLEFGETIGGSLAEVAATLANLVATFGLSSGRASRVRTVRALVISSVVLVEDMYSRKLGGYGAVHPELAEQLDPLLHRLRDLLLAIGHALPPPRPGRQTPA
jgi:hypothetical protein